MSGAQLAQISPDTPLQYGGYDSWPVLQKFLAQLAASNYSLGSVLPEHNFISTLD